MTTISDSDAYSDLTQSVDKDAQAVLDFWFAAETRPFWFVKSDEFDKTINERFGGLLETAFTGGLWDW